MLNIYFSFQAGYREGRSYLQSSAPNISELATRTVTMSRDTPDGTHGFGICVKGGKDAGKQRKYFIFFSL